LRGLLVFCAIASVWLGIWINRAREQRKVVEWAEAHDWTVCFDHQVTFNKHGYLTDDKTDSNSLFLHSIQDWISENVTCKVVYLNYQGTNKVPEFGSLSKLNDLKMIDLSFTEISDLTPLSEFKSVTYLDLDHTKITDVSPLTKMHNLKMLFLNGTNIEDFTPIGDISALETLEVGDTTIRDLSAFKKLPKLKTVYIYNTLVSPKQAKHFERIKPTCDVQGF
jgi:hypothetical protein